MTPGTKLGLILAVAMFVIVGGYFLFVPGERPSGMRDAELPAGEAASGSVDAPELIRTDELSGDPGDALSGAVDETAEGEIDNASDEANFSDATEIQTGGNDLVIMTWPARDERATLLPELPDREVASFDWDSLTRDLPPSQDAAGGGAGAVSATPGPTANEPAAIEPSASNDVYIVQKGDSFWSIARSWYGDGAMMELIVQANPGVNPDRLQIGQRLNMPPSRAGARANAGALTSARKPEDSSSTRRTPAGGGPATHTVREGDTLVRIARQYFNDDSKWQAIYAANRALIGADPDKLKLGMKLTIPR